MKIKAKDLEGYMALSNAVDGAICKKGRTHLTLHIDATADKKNDITGLLMALCDKGINSVGSVTTSSIRSVEMNALWSAMYKEIWKQGAMESFMEARAYCKWHMGLGILKRDSEGFQESYDKVFSHLAYEHQLKLMNSNRLFPGDGFPVTRCFGVQQGKEYIGLIADHFIGDEAPHVDFREVLS